MLASAVLAGVVVHYYHPEPAELEALGYRPDPAQHRCYQRPHPHRAHTTCRLYLHDSGELTLVEYDARQRPGLTRFRGWCPAESDFHTALRMARWA